MAYAINLLHVMHDHAGRCLFKKIDRQVQHLVEHPLDLDAAVPRAKRRKLLVGLALGFVIVGAIDLDVGPAEGRLGLAAGERIGEVTSGSLSPSLNEGIGMAYVASALAKIGTEIQIEVRDRKLPAVIEKKPLYKKS